MKKEQLLIDCYKAAKLMECTVHNVWAMIRRLSLKAVKRDGKLYTCEEWIDEYQLNKRNKDFHSIFNGRRVFDPEKGELSMQMVCQELGVCKTTVMYYIHTGRLKTSRKGHYYVIARSELNRFKAEEYIQEEAQA